MTYSEIKRNIAKKLNRIDLAQLSMAKIEKFNLTQDEKIHLLKLFVVTLKLVRRGISDESDAQDALRELNFGGITPEYENSIYFSICGNIERSLRNIILNIIMELVFSLDYVEEMDDE